MNLNTFLCIFLFIQLVGCKGNSENKSVPKSSAFVPVKNNCDKNTFEVSMPEDHKNPQKASFQYTYQYIQNNNTDKVMVYLTGGPGQAGIGKGFFPTSNLISINSLIIEPRGIGCNYESSKSIKNTFLLTNQHVEDIAYLLKNLKISKYYLYGVSYGTEVATRLAARSNELELPYPQAVILDSVVYQNAPNSSNLGELFDPLIEKEKKVQSFLDIFLSDSELPFVESRYFWLIFISENIKNVELPMFLAKAANGEKMKNSSLWEVFEKKSSDFINPFSKVKDFPSQHKGGERVHSSIYCLEGTAVYLRKDIPYCSWWSFNDYDPKSEVKSFIADDFVIPSKVPIYLFWGRKDDLTPEEDYQKFKAVQGPKSRIVEVIIDEGGHALFSSEIASCSVEIYESIIKLDDNFDEILDRQNLCVQL